MGQLGLHGARRGTRRRTTIADAAAARPADLVGRNFTRWRPDVVWVADFTHVATWSGTVYVAFVIDVHARRILGWRAATTMRTELVLDALEMAIWTRARAGVSDLTGLIHHHDAGSQGEFNRSSQHLVDGGGVRWCAGSSGRTGRCVRRCAPLGGLSRAGMWSASSGV
jgi:putative transposase